MRKNKSVPAFLIFIVFMVTLQATIAGEYVLVKPGTWTGEFNVPGAVEVCSAYEKNLQKYQDEPFAMACERVLDPKAGFTRPEWKKIDPNQYKDLVKDIHRFKRWKNMPTDTEIAERVSEGRLTMDLAKLDMDYDGILDNLVRVGGKAICDPEEAMTHKSSLGHKTLIRTNKELTKVDNKTRGISGIDNVFIYKGRVYTDEVHVGAYGVPVRVPENGRPVATLKLEAFYTRSDLPICRYTYFATD